MTGRRRALLVFGMPSALAAAAWWLLTEAAPDAARYLAGALPTATEARVSAYDEVGCREGRTCLDLELSLSDGSSLRAAVSLPDPLPATALPSLLLFGGFETGRRALALLPDPGRNALVTYEYPVDRALWRDAGPVRRFLIAQRTAHRVPRQLAVLLRWIRTRPWSDPERLTAAGVSLGALLLPAARRLADAQGEPEGFTVLAYGGVDGEAIVAANLDLEPDWLGGFAAWALGSATRGIEPAAHLPHLRGPLLIVSARDDDLIPAASVAGLHRLAPEPKEIVILDGGHIRPDAERLLSDVLETVRRWLLAERAINP